MCTQPFFFTLSGSGMVGWYMMTGYELSYAMLMLLFASDPLEVYMICSSDRLE